MAVLAEAVRVYDRDAGFGMTRLGDEYGREVRYDCGKATIDAIAALGDAARALLAADVPGMVARLQADARKWERGFHETDELALDLIKQRDKAEADAAKSRAELLTEKGLVDRIRNSCTVHIDGAWTESITLRDWCREVDQHRASARKDRGDSDAG